MDIAIILAAGEGTRMKSETPKVLHKVSGKPLLKYIMEASQQAELGKTVVVIGYGGEKVEKHFQDEDVVFKTQPIGEGAAYGTGFAVMQAVDEIGDNDRVVILCGDTPLMTGDTIESLLDYHKENNCSGTVLTAVLDDTTGYGRIKRDEEGNVSRIVEEKDASEEEKEIKEINSGVYCFQGELLKKYLSELDNDNSQNEYYITDIVEILKREGYKLGAYVVEDEREIHGVNSRKQLSYSEEIMRERINNFHMEEGVTIVDASNTYIEGDVKIGRDTIIYPGASLERGTIIGENCVIKGDTIVTASVIGDNVEIISSNIEHSKVEDACSIGPNAHLRPESHLGKNVHIGNFVEVKKAHIKEGSKAGHLAYIGDAIVGKNVNIGCGVIFANYNGKSKSQTIVGDNSFIGSNSNLVAPVKINDWGYVAAGSTITKDVEEGALSIGRATQVNKPGWVEKKGLKNK